MTRMRGSDKLMKNNSLAFLTKTIFALFFIGTIISLFIVYKDIDNSIAVKFVIGYAIFALLLLIYVPIITVINSKRLKWVEIRKRIFKFILLFAFFGALHYGFDYFFRPEKMDLLRQFSTAFGLAFGMSFIDVTLLKREEYKFK